MMDQQNAIMQSDYSTDNLQQLPSTGVVGCFQLPLECSHTPSNLHLENSKDSPGGQVGKHIPNLAQASAYLIALGTRFANHGQDHSLNFLFAELDAFKARFYNLSSSAQPPYINTLSSLEDAVYNNLDLSLASNDRVASAATCTPSFTGLGQIEPHNLDSNFTIDLEPHLVNNGAGAWQLDDPFQSPNNDPSTQAGLYHDAAPLQAPNPNASYHSAVCLASTSNHRNNSDWNEEDFNNLFDFGASTTEDPDVMNGPTVDQVTYRAPNPSNFLPPASVSATATGPAGRNFQCSHCAKSFLYRKDLNRHALSHDPNATRYYCPSSTCNRYFLRKDKLAAHRRSKRH